MIVSARCRSAIVLLLGLAACGDDRTGEEQSQRPAAGLRVEQVAPQGAADRAGIRPGGTLIAWAVEGRDPEPLSQAFQLRWLEYEVAPRSPIVLELEQQRGRSTVRLPAGSWRIEARPKLPDDLLSVYLEAVAASEDGDPGAAVSRYRAAAKAAEDPAIAVFLLERAGEAAVAGRFWDQAHLAYEEAVRAADGLDLPGWVAVLYRAQADIFRSQGNAADAERHYSLAIDQLSERGDLPLIHALCLQARGEFRLRSGKLAEAEADMQAALEVRRREAPAGLWFGRSIGALATIRLARGQLTEAKAETERALEIEEQHVSGSITSGAYLSNLGMIAYLEGDLISAEAKLRRYLEILEGQDGDILRRASVSNNLSIVRAMLGDLQGAEDLLRESVSLKASVQEEETAEVAISLSTLAEVLRLRDKLAEAEQVARRALAIKEAVAPNSVSLASTLGTLGNIARDRGELELAEEFYEKAGRIFRRDMPGSMEVGRVLSNQAAAAMRANDLGRAEELAREALEIERRLTMESQESTRTLRLLGRILYQKGQLEDASLQYEKVLDALDRLGRQQGASDLRQILFWHTAAGFYSEAIEILVERGLSEEAFAALERSRARALLRLLAERGMENRLAPADLRAEILGLGRRYEKRQQVLAGLSVAKDQQEIEKLRAELRELRRRQEHLWEKAAASRPKPLPELAPPVGAAELKAALDTGTLMLAYVVGERRTTLMTLSRGDGPRSWTLELGAGELRREVEAFRAGIRDGRRREGASGIRLHTAWRLGRQLYDRLIRPAERWVQEAERLVILPDGALHDLPFAALVVSEGEAEVEYLIERKPLSIVPSGSFLVTPRRSAARPKNTMPRVVAFGDPEYPKPKSLQEDDVVRNLSGAIGGLHPLPGSRREVEKIAAIFPGSRTFLGAEATEESVRRLEGVDYLHLACHGISNPRSPLDSAIALSIPRTGEAEVENGILQAWEIVQDMRLDADLVVLSACRSAAGQLMGGEGLVGLTRAFQAAGARSVVAPLWNVKDDLAPELMERLYAELKAGEPKDEALRRAQLYALSSQPLSDSLDTEPFSRPPYFWAAFQLYGDFR